MSKNFKFKCDSHFSEATANFLKIYLITSKLLETTPVLLVSSRFKEFINLCYANLASLNLTIATSIRAVKKLIFKVGPYLLSYKTYQNP